MRKIESLEELDALLLKEGAIECFIQLNHGLKSSKYINKNGDNYYIYNYADDTEDIVDKTSIFDKNITNVGDAMNKGALFYRIDTINGE